MHQNITKEIREISLVVGVAIVVFQGCKPQSCPGVFPSDHTLQQRTTFHYILLELKTPAWLASLLMRPTWRYPCLMPWLQKQRFMVVMQFSRVWVITECSLITGRGGYETIGVCGGQVKFYPYKKGAGGARNILAILKGGGGREKYWGSFLTWKLEVLTILEVGGGGGHKVVTL